MLAGKATTGTWFLRESAKPCSKAASWEQGSGPFHQLDTASEADAQQVQTHHLSWQVAPEDRC